MEDGIGELIGKAFSGEGSSDTVDELLIVLQEKYQINGSPVTQADIPLHSISEDLGLVFCQCLAELSVDHTFFDAFDTPPQAHEEHLEKEELYSMESLQSLSLEELLEVAVSLESKLDQSMRTLGALSVQYVKSASRLGRHGIDVLPLDSMFFFERKHTNIKNTFLKEKIREASEEKSFWEEMLVILQKKLAEDPNFAKFPSAVYLEELEEFSGHFKAAVENTKSTWAASKAQISPQTFSRVIDAEFRKFSNRTCEELRKLEISSKTSNTLHNHQLERKTQLGDLILPVLHQSHLRVFNLL